MPGQRPVAEPGGLRAAAGDRPAHPDHLAGRVNPERADAEAAHHARSGKHDVGLGPDAQPGPLLQLPGQHSLHGAAVGGFAVAHIGLDDDAGAAFGQHTALGGPDPVIVQFPAGDPPAAHVRSSPPARRAQPSCSCWRRLRVATTRS